jgi:ubiquinone/menaquinone biosynthesis C-methylase UbiE
MAAAYDTYDYPSYWRGRDYEHEAETLAIEQFFKKISRCEKILDMGSGFGRLTPLYIDKCKTAILADPSKKLLNIAQNRFPQKKVKFINSRLETLPKKIKPKSIDVILVIRVLHHIIDVDKAIDVIKKLLKKNGYLIMEFANKRHIKATFCEFCRGNLTFPLDLFPKDRRSKKNKENKTIPFYNYHPDQIIEKLKSVGFTIQEVRSVSNIRSRRAKKIIPAKILLFFEKHTQKLFSRHFLGPSIFVLARKNR